MVQDYKKKNLHRIKIIKGQVAAIEKLLQNDEYCIKIVHQSLSVQKALKKLDMQLMEHHLSHCVVDKTNLDKNNKIIQELISIYNYK